MHVKNYLFLGSVLLASVFVSSCLGQETTSSASDLSTAAPNSTENSLFANATFNNITADSAAQKNGSNFASDLTDATGNNKTDNGTDSAGESSESVPATTDAPDNSTEASTVTLHPDSDNSTALNDTIHMSTARPDETNATESANQTGTTGAPTPGPDANTTENSTTVQPKTEPPSGKPYPYTVKISETNLLLVEDTQSDSLFIELQGKPGEDLTNLWLVVRNAGLSRTENSLLVKMGLQAKLDSNGIYLLENSTGLNVADKLSSVQAVFVGLYREESQAESLGTEGLLDLLLYSSQGGLDQSLREMFAHLTQYPLTLDYSQLASGDQQISLSRCSMASSNAAFLLSRVSRGEENSCALTSTRALEMWLSLEKQPCPDQLPQGFEDSLIEQVISGVNGLKKCGLSRLMLKDMHASKSCISKKETRVDVHFTVQAALASQLKLVVQGYQSFVSDPAYSPLQLTDGDYLLHNCTSLCRAPMVNPQNPDSDKKTQVTIGVVLTCVGVFIVVLLVVIMYMKKKRRGILQFRMTRLDEDDDDMIGDMDDFVGNQGPTFRNFR